MQLTKLLCSCVSTKVTRADSVMWGHIPLSATCWHGTHLATVLWVLEEILHGTCTISLNCCIYFRFNRQSRVIFYAPLRSSFFMTQLNVRFFHVFSLHENSDAIGKGDFVAIKVCWCPAWIIRVFQVSVVTIHRHYFSFDHEINRKLGVLCEIRCVRI